MMRSLHLIMFMSVLGLLLASCDSDSDSGGTTGGSGEPATTETVSNSTSTSFTLDAFDFDCTSNWGDRDGALGIKAYSGSGTCSATFPGPSGTYRMILKAVTEYDGESPYRVSINGQTIQEGSYPLSSSLGCDCPHDDWRSVCPDRDRDIDLGAHTLRTGDRIGFYGNDVYPCGEEHGAYTKWRGISFRLAN